MNTPYPRLDAASTAPGSPYAKTSFYDGFANLAFGSATDLLTDVDDRTRMRPRELALAAAVTGGLALGGFARYRASQERKQERALSRGVDPAKVSQRIDHGAGPVYTDDTGRVDWARTAVGHVIPYGLVGAGVGAGMGLHDGLVMGLQEGREAALRSTSRRARRIYRLALPMYGIGYGLSLGTALGASGGTATGLAMTPVTLLRHKLLPEQSRVADVGSAALAGATLGKLFDGPGSYRGAGIGAGVGAVGSLIFPSVYNRLLPQGTKTSVSRFTPRNLALAGAGATVGAYGLSRLMRPRSNQASADPYGQTTNPYAGYPLAAPY